MEGYFPQSKNVIASPELLEGLAMIGCLDVPGYAIELKGDPFSPWFCRITTSDLIRRVNGLVLFRSPLKEKHNALFLFSFSIAGVGRHGIRCALGISPGVTAAIVIP